MCKRALLHSQRYNKCSRVGAIIMQRPCEYAVGSVGILGAPFSYLRNDFDLHRNGCKKAGCVSTVSTTTHEKDLIVVTSCVCELAPSLFGFDKAQGLFVALIIVVKIARVSKEQ